MASKKKGKRPKRRIIDTAGQIDEVPGSDIEPGGGIDEAESVEKVARVKKAAKEPEVEKKADKTVRKPPQKKPSAYASLKKFLKDVQAEAKKVVWPDSEQLKNSTAVVVFTIIVLAAFMGFFSNVFYQISNRAFMPDVKITAPSQTTDNPEYTPGAGGEEGGGGEAGNGAPADAEGTS